MAKCTARGGRAGQGARSGGHSMKGWGKWDWRRPIARARARGVLGGGAGQCRQCGWLHRFSKPWDGLRIADAAALPWPPLTPGGTLPCVWCVGAQRAGLAGRGDGGARNPSDVANKNKEDFRQLQAGNHVPGADWVCGQDASSGPGLPVRS